MSASGSAESRSDIAAHPEAQAPATPCGALWSSQPIGAKVSALRSESVHLVHTGVPEGWNGDEIDSFFAAAAETLGVPEPGTMTAPTALPATVQGWAEAIRFGQEELWNGASELGTTLVADAGEHLWVVSRGAHRLDISCTTGDALPERPAGIAGDLRACRLEIEEGWRIEVTLKESPGALWSARWRPAPRPLAVESSEDAPALPQVTEPELIAASAAPSAGPAGRAAALGHWLRIWIGALVRTVRRPEHRRVVIGVGALIACVFAVAVAPKQPMVAAATWIGDVVAGRYRAHVTSTPVGAEIAIDGRASGARTPAWIVVPAGKHHLRLSLGEFGDAETEVDGGRGARLDASVALFGRLAVGSADSSVALYAQLDGRSIGVVPAVLDSVPAGRRRLSFQGRDVRPWTEEVKVIAGKRSVVIARPERVPEFGHVLARAFRVGPTGLVDLPGARIVLDGRPVGSTPLSLQVPRGLHTVRLAAGSEQSPVQLLRVEGGGELHATAEFGRSPEPEVAEELSGPVSIADPPLVRASLAGTVPLRLGEVRLFFRHKGRDFQRLSMALKEGSLGSFGEVELPLAGVEPGDDLSYFVVVESDEGEEFVSEMRRLRVLP